MGKYLDEYIAKYGDPLASAPPQPDASSAQEYSGLSPQTTKRLKIRMLEGRFKKERGRGFTQGERSLVENNGEGMNVEDLRQHRDLLTWLGSTNEDIDKALSDAGAYKLEKTPESAKDWGIPKMVGEEAKRVGGILINPAKQLLTGHPINAVKEAGLTALETFSGVGAERDLLDTQRKVAWEGVPRLLGAAREGVQAVQNKAFVDPLAAPGEAAGAFWKQLTEGGDEQQKKIAETMRLNKGAGENALISEHSNKYKYLPNYSTVLGQFADPLNYAGFGLGGKLAKRLGIVDNISKLGIESAPLKAMGDALASKLGTQEEKWAAEVGKEAGKDIVDSLTSKVVNTAIDTEKLGIDLAKNFSEPKVFEFLKKLPYVGESGAKSITNILRSIPVLGKKFGVSQAEQGDVFRAIEGMREITPDPFVGTQGMTTKAPGAVETLGGVGVRRGDTVFGTLKRSGGDEIRVAADEAMKRFDALSPAGKRAARWFVQNREEFKALAGVASDIEGYIPHVWEEGLFGAGAGKFALTQQKAKGLMQRAVEEGTGYVENAEKAIKSRYEEIIAKNYHNKAVDEIAEKVAVPIPENGVVPEGFTALNPRQLSAAGLPTNPTRMMPTELYDEIVRYGEAAKTVGGVKGLAQKLGNFFKSNILLAPGTAVTNALGGGAQYAGRVVENMAKAITGGGVKPLMNDLTALLGALKPGNIEKIRPELWGGKSALFGELGKATNPLTKLINAGLTPFGAIENYWKRVITLSELGAKGGKGLSKEMIAADRALLSELNSAVDRYAFNYENVPKFIKDARTSWWGWAVMPFPTYGYKLARYYSRYGAALNPFILMDPADRLARIATLATLGGAGVAVAPGHERKHIEGMTSQVDTTGRSKVGESGGKEQWLRTVKYPWANLGQAVRGGAALFKGDEDVLGNVAGEFVAEGPLVEGIKIAAGWGNRFEVYKPKGLRVGEVVAGFIPGTRITQGLKASGGGERVLPTGFTEAVVNAIPFTGMQGKIQMDRVTRKPVMLDPNIEAMKFWLGLSMKEIDPKRYSMERQKKLKAAITAISDAQNTADLNKAVDRLETVDPERLASIADKIRKKRLTLDGETLNIVNGIMQKEAMGKVQGAVKAGVK